MHQTIYIRGLENKKGTQKKKEKKKKKKKKGERRRKRRNGHPDSPPIWSSCTCSV
jgi:hypothetical protein